MISSSKNEILDILGKNLPGVIFYRFVRDEQGNMVFDYISDNVEQFTGYTSKEVIANPHYLLDTTLPKYKSALQIKQEESFLNLTIFNIEIECNSINDGIRWVEITSAPEKLPDGRVAWLGIQTDITEHKQTELKLHKYNHELKLLNNINDIISNTDDEDYIYELICSCLITKGDYKLAWVCHRPSKNSPSKIINPIAAAGVIEYLEHIQIDLNDINIQKGPTEHVLLNGGKYINNNAETNNNFNPWLETALKYGIRSSIVLELDIYKGRKSALNIYSSNSNAFDENEVLVLERVARNVSAAVKNIHLEREKKETTYQLNERVKELRTIYEINNILQGSSNSIEHTLQEIVNIIPNGWQFSNYCVARITFSTIIYTSPHFEETVWSQSEDIIIDNTFLGKIEVFYLHEMKKANEGPFLKEERKLINTIAKLIASYYDKTQTYHQLLSSEANLKSIFDHTEVGYLLLDLQYNIISFNTKLTDEYLKNTKIKAAIGLNFLDIIDVDRKKYIEKIFKKVIAEISPIEYEFNYHKTSDSDFFNIMVVPIVDNNKTIGICLSAYNITKRRNEEIFKEKLTSELLQRNRDLEQFAYIVSHNLRAPVANILGLTTLFDEKMSELDRVDIIHKLNTSTLRLDSVIKDLNNILQIRREISELKTELDFETLIEHVKESISNIIYDQNISFELDFSKAKKINSIKTYLDSIFFNLITNSIKYSRENTPVKISISTDQKDNYITIHYKDNCQGIDLEKHGEQIFGLYKKFNTQVEGKGIGLFMVKTQVEVMGGTINIGSTLNVGTEFTITLPAL